MGLNPMILWTLGVWPNPHATTDKDCLSNCRVIIAGFFLMCFICVPQSADLFVIWGNVDQMTENLAMANITVLTTFVKLLILWYHKEALRLLLVAFIEDWKACKSKEERSIMLEYGVMARRISIGCTVLAQATVITFLSSRTAEIMKLDRNVTDADRFSVYPAYFPYDIRESPAFEFTLAGQYIAACYTGTCFSAVDSFVSMLVLHNCGQLSTLRQNVENMFNENAEKRSKEKFHSLLVDIVERHEHLNWYGRTIEDCFNMQLLAQMLASTVQLCFQGFQAFSILTQGKTEVPTIQVIFIVVYLGFIMVHLYLYCYVGDMLIVQSSEIGYSAYEAKWYNVPPVQAKNLLLLMLRSRTPQRLTAGKFGTFSLELFSNILKTSLGYLSVLLTVAN